MEGKKGNILIVDDTPENIDILVSLLQDYNRKIALNGEKALLLAEAEPKPDLILLDIMMPGMSGFEVCIQLRKNETTKDIPIVFITAMNSQENILTGFKIGGQDYIAKPFDFNELIARVEAQMEIVNYRKKLLTMNHWLEEKVNERTLELKAAKLKAEAANRAKTMFLANINHELRTPLNGIVGFGSLLIDANLDEESRTYLNIINESADNLLKVITEIIDYSNIDTTNVVVNENTFNAAETINKAINFLEIKAIHKELRIIRNFANTGELIIGDELKIRQILLNIIANAIKFTNEGTIEITSSVFPISSEKGELVISVSDTGIGIPEDKIDLIFEQFYMIDESHTREYGGLGLGLSLAKELIDTLHAKIEIKSKVNEGSIFTLKFPVVYSEINSTDESSTNESDIQVKRILIAEDNIINQKLIKLILTQQKHLVTVVENGALAVEIVAKEHFDFVFMDIQMPVMDGLEATREIRKLPGNGIHQLPIVALTAHTTPEDRRLCIEAGMIDMINKPVKKEILYNAILKYAK
ncbi:MAG: response regulator [Prolixibacteraceae bacterium]|jgi:CheY-like chemotaxis protein|nr:response regulator [Prolixibacteraceae bacterium]